MSGMYLTSMTRFYAQLLQNYESQNKTDRRKDFFYIVADKEKDAMAVTESGNLQEELIAEMSMEEYKQYIYYKIAQIPMNPSQMQDFVSVSISDEGFEAMKRDAEYEKWVLESLKKEFAFFNPWSNLCGGCFRIYRFGATKEEYRGESWPMDSHSDRSRNLLSQKKEKSFWEKRAKRHKEYMELCQKAWLKRQREQEYLDDIALHKRQINSKELQNWSLEQMTGVHKELDINPSVLSQAATLYAQNYIFYKIPSPGSKK